MSQKETGLTTPDWMQQTYSISWLRERAHERRGLTGMMLFLRTIGVVPWDAPYTRRQSIPNTNLNPDAISAIYLAGFANGWDDLGDSDPVEAIDALSAEVVGEPRHAVVTEAIREVLSANLSAANERLRMAVAA